MKLEDRMGDGEKLIVGRFGCRPLKPGVGGIRSCKEKEWDPGDRGTLVRPSCRGSELVALLLAAMLLMELRASVS